MTGSAEDDTTSHCGAWLDVGAEATREIIAISATNVHGTPFKPISVAEGYSRGHYACSLSPSVGDSNKLQATKKE
jgi:hypothetical protein